MRVLENILGIIKHIEDSFIEEYRHEISRGIPPEDLSLAMTHLLLENYIQKSGN